MTKKSICRVTAVVLLIIALLAVVCAVTVTGSGFLDISNVAKIAFSGTALFCTAAAAVMWRMSNS